LAKHLAFTSSKKKKNSKNDGKEEVGFGGI
jgi:hypothetical protein